MSGFHPTARSLSATLVRRFDRLSIRNLKSGTGIGAALYVAIVSLHGCASPQQLSADLPIITIAASEPDGPVVHWQRIPALDAEGIVAYINACCTEEEVVEVLYDRRGRGQPADSAARSRQVVWLVNCSTKLGKVVASASSAGQMGTGKSSYSFSLKAGYSPTPDAGAICDFLAARPVVPDRCRTSGDLTYLGMTVALSVPSENPSTYSASYKIPDSDVSLEIHLTHMHPHLAEYERRLIVHGLSDADVSEDLFPDTGGYSRVNLYLLAPKRFVITTEGNHKYDIDLNHARLRAVPTGNHTRPAGARYVGAFDWKDNRWRFIPAQERAELSIGELALTGRGSIE